jgi:O-methyltransferase
MFYWIPQDKIETFNKALTEIAAIYPGQLHAHDMLVTMGKNLTFTGEARFMSSFNSTASSRQEQSLIWRLHVLAWAASHALHVPGDFVECGVYQGFSSAVLCKYLNFATVPKTLYLYDTFSGLPTETSTPEERDIWQAYYALDPQKLLNAVKKTFSPYPNVKIVQGIVPVTFTEACPEAISYLHIDMNSAQAEVLALDHLFDRVSPGGLIVFDDFGWICNRAQTEAELGFMRKRGYAILELPTGQGLVLKR